VPFSLKFVPALPSFSLRQWALWHLSVLCFLYPLLCPIFFSRFLVQGFDSHVKCLAYPSFIGGLWDPGLFLPVPPGFFFQIRLSPTRTDAAALCPFPLTSPPSAASILNSLGRQICHHVFLKGHAYERTCQQFT
jgi:hypothetical protein